MAKILIVDDEPRIRELIRENLQYSGYTCEEAGDGSAALSLLTGGGYDLVILDLTLPDSPTLLDLGFLYQTFRIDLGLLRLTFALRRNAGNLRCLLRLAGRNLLLLLQGGEGLIFLDGQLELGCFVIFLGNRNRRILLDLVALAGTLLCLLRQLGQALGIEGVLGIEKLYRRLVEAGQTDRLKLQAIFQQIL